MPRVSTPSRQDRIQLTVFAYSWCTTPIPGRPQLIYIHDPHTEFVVGCGWSLYEEGILASCGWDSRLNVFRVP